MERLKGLTFLMVDDDEDDCFLVRECLRETGLPIDFRELRDGEALIDYLYRRGKFAGHDVAPSPDLILLDLNMPKKNGREVLEEIKSDPDLRDIPIVIFTTSREPEDISLCRDAGVYSFVVKPSVYTEFAEVVSGIARRRFENTGRDS